ncbi:APC family permease [Paenarthrobacter aurescens]|jgi:amino acid transporter|uniref:Amino acid permease n=1 Tax=Paenarthrobacter aurescens (strain TC1) TaxID=290340 RepID=A1RDG9_PAEAT|nr:APC family permease [Paenarthrobacter aurescens]ABM10814.1 putative amino acid permease [Paenarthrobacter aurescens TC1]
MAVQGETIHAQPHETSGLRKNTIGAFGMTFMVIAAAAPMTAMASNLSISLALGVGQGTVGQLIVVAALLAVFAVGFVILSRHVTNAGAYFVFIGYGLGKRTGAAAAFVASVAYNMAAGGMIAATGYFASITLESNLGVSVPWYVCRLVALAITALLGIRGVSIAQKFTTGISLIQFGIIIVLGVAILIQRPEGWSLNVFSPSEAFSGNVALTLVFCVLSFAGFEATAIYGEEAKAARRSIKVATYSSLALLAIVFIFSTWSIVAAFDDVAAVAAEDAGTLVFRTADIYLGAWSGPLLSAVVTVSFLAAAIAFHNMAARYLFALGRSKLLPAPLARTHTRFGTPHISSWIQIAISAAMLLPFVLTQADPIVNLFPAVSGITSLSLTSLMIGCCVSIVAARMRKKLQENAWATLYAPILSGAGLLAIVLIIIANYQQVTGSDALIIALMPAIPAAAAVYGAIAYRSNRTGEALEDHLTE